MRRCAQLHLRMYSPQRLLIVTSPVASERHWDSAETKLYISPAAQLEIERKERNERDGAERRKEGSKGLHLLEGMIDMHELKKTKPTEHLSDDDIVEQAREQHARRKRQGEKEMNTIDVAIHQARKMLGEGPNRDKRFTTVVPAKLKGDANA